MQLMSDVLSLYFPVYQFLSVHSLLGLQFTQNAIQRQPSIPTKKTNNVLHRWITSNNWHHGLFHSRITTPSAATPLAGARFVPLPETSCCA